MSFLYFKRIAPLSFTFLVSLAACWGQTSTTQLSGTVFDNSGAVLPAAAVTVTNDATGTVQKELTNNAGLFSFPSMPVGTYTVSVEMQGFKTTRRTNVTLVVGTPLTENITLELGDTHDVVKVEASADNVNTSNATLGNVIEKQAVSTLPLNGRNPLNLVVLEPGVTQRSGTTINVNGLRSQAGNVTIDGIEANEASNPTPTNNVFRINPDNVEEFKVDHQQSHSGRGQELRAEHLHCHALRHECISLQRHRIFPQYGPELQRVLCQRAGPARAPI